MCKLLLNTFFDTMNNTNNKIIKNKKSFQKLNFAKYVLVHYHNIHSDKKKIFNYYK